MPNRIVSGEQVIEVALVQNDAFSIGDDTTKGNPDKWTPIVAGPQAHETRKIVEEIALRILDPNPAWLRLDAESMFDADLMPIVDGALAGGHTGISLLYGYLAMAYGEPKHRMQAEATLDKSIQLFSESAPGMTLFTGYMGLGWTMEHLTRMLFTKDEGADLEALDELLSEYLYGVSGPFIKFDLVDGLSGIGVYVLERMPTDMASKHLEKIVSLLDGLAEKQEGTVTWRTPREFIVEHDDFTVPNGYYNLGLAHGVPGIIAFLARVHAAGIAKQETRALIEGAVRWVLQNQLPEESVTLFCKWFEPGKPKPGATRVAWCYGDPGVAIALLNAAIALEDDELRAEAIRIAKRAASIVYEETSVMDAGICHGSSGLLQIYNRIYQATGDIDFLDATKFWFDKTLEMCNPETGIGGYLSHRAKYVGDPDPLYCEAGLISGTAGTALALLACITDVEPAWDRLLLISDPLISKKA